MKRIGVDVGGTFTDAVLYDDEEGVLASAKTFSTYPDLEQGVVAAVSKLGSATSLPDLRFLVHGTTAATNAVIERSGPRVAVLTTEGFRDVLEIGRLMRTAEEIYDLKAPQTTTLTLRRDRFEIRERISSDGTVRIALDEDTVRAAAREIGRRGIETVAVCLLYAHLNGEHERRIRDILADELPEVHVSLSSEVLPERREYERGSTTVLNAYLAPIVSSYLESLGEVIDRWRANTTLWIMQSNGGMTSPRRASRLPVNLLMSGPSGGVVAGQLVARQTGMKHALTVDMGGTSFDACLLPSGKPTITYQRSVLGQPAVVPSVDVLAVGAGGGSIGWVDTAGQFRVGPQSAGADPGPACYGRGGREPTVTDANLVLGIFADGQRLGDEVTLDRSAAYRACARLGDRLGIGPVETAWGIRKIVNTAMAGAVHAVSVGRGYDPRDFGMIAFGGAGPMHAVDIAAELDMPVVALPRAPGCQSAVGMVVTEVSHDYTAPVAGTVAASLEPELTATLAQLERTADTELADEAIPEESRAFAASIDLRYQGQQTSVTVPITYERATGWLDLVVHDFHQLHEQLYGFRVEDEPVDVTNVRLRSTGWISDAEPLPEQTTLRGSKPMPREERTIMLSPDEKADIPVYQRGTVAPGVQWMGPAIIEQDDTTTWISGDHLIRCDAYGNLIVHRSSS